ncbi:trypsin-like peptidase domain-containing protein [Streptomyces sp. F-7]|uniref:trypsin-like peptidase domain-containing protein n=1 Tax=Streptomyces sp. F-7 TaxID=573566 RepID=UPI000AA5C772|nr:trypsin-like peptidase domain-containing protein [Streptomyces sp. F-7]
MNEGKPGTPGASEGPDGDFELARPIGTASPGTGPDGDYELRRPLDTAAAPPSTDGTSGAGAAAGPGRLGGAPGAVASGTGAEPTPAGPDAGTTIGGARPADTGAEHITGVETAEHGAPAAPVPGAEPPASGHSGPAPAPGAEAPASGHSGPAPAPGAEAPASGPTRPAPAHGAHAPAQPRPLHDPDPYSTPPYGEPGPWAPAPPVQHPAATPAHGVAVGAPEAVSAAPVAQEAPAADPWARYDPWAAPAVAPLQQADPVEEDVKRRRGRRRRTLIGGALIIALVSGVAGGVVGVQLERSGGIGAVELPQAGVEAPDRDPDSVAGIAAQALPSVVTLHVSGGGRAGTGTGFVLDDRGHILTNDHVVEPAGENGDITVTFHSGDTAEATVVGRDSGYDLAVVRVKGVRGLTPLPLGNSDNVQVGDPVVAIGAPFDLAGTVTSGIISARERPITAGGEKGDGSDVSYVDALQTDAPINPGNSGGPLLDGKGRVIGINSAIRSADGGLDPEGGQSGSIGLGFAIPINQGKRVAEELIETGKATHPVIGITLDMEYSGDGARVAAEGSDGGPPVSTGGPGAKAGIRPGDVITEVDGRPVHSGEELIVKTRAHRPGDRLELTLERDGEERTVSLVLGSSGGG